MDNNVSQARNHRDGSLSSERRWHGIVGACSVAAILLLWNNQLDVAFVIATLGAVAWFMPLRNRSHHSPIEASAISHTGAEDSEDKDEDKVF